MNDLLVVGSKKFSVQPVPYCHLTSSWIDREPFVRVCVFIIYRIPVLFWIRLWNKLNIDKYLTVEWLILSLGYKVLRFHILKVLISYWYWELMPESASLAEYSLTRTVPTTAFSAVSTASDCSVTTGALSFISVVVTRTTFTRRRGLIK